LFVVSGLWSRFNFFGVWDVICIVYVGIGCASSNLEYVFL